MDFLSRYFSIFWIIVRRYFFSFFFTAAVTDTDTPPLHSGELQLPEISSSPSSSASGDCTAYDVFLSFRGEDTRNNFVDHLYTALDQRGIITFKDDQKLKRGNSISTELLKAIEKSRFALVLFSRNYASSSWCLDELATIIECRGRFGLTVLPVFYDVRTSDVREQTGSFAAAFAKHKLKYSGGKLKRWRNALTTAAGISGFDIPNMANGHESECIKQIVRDILRHVKLHPVDNLIGMNSHVQKLKLLLDLGSSDVRMIGIWGMAGIGKTTIARAVFRQISSEFEGGSFVEDVRENGYSKRGLKSLQEKILSEILMEEHLKICDCDDGINQMKRRLRHKKVLVVLDDVDNIKHLEFLAARDCFGHGSRIIVTSRDAHVISTAHGKYTPELLNMDQAMMLFSRHAFRRNSPPKQYKMLSDRAVYYTGCLPLALKVLGSFLRDRKLGVWESALDRLAKVPNNEIYETIKLSFDGLDLSEQKIFLDIACFFKGQNGESVNRILDSFGFDPVIGVSVLIEKSLLTVSKGRILMHDLIQEMGWHIVRLRFPNSRLWLPVEISDVMAKATKLEAIEAIMLDDYYVHFSADVFASTKNLRLLHIRQGFVSSEPNSLPDELQWLSWYKYPFYSLPRGLRKLVGIELPYSDVKQLWSGQKMLLNLKFISLLHSASLTSFPDVSGAPNLEKLILEGCSNLIEVHPSVGVLKRLVFLNLSSCGKLECLPSSLEMKSLETLILSYCRNLKKLPRISTDMGRLSEIHLRDCSMIEELPSSFGSLSGLTLLNLESCFNLQCLPRTICELTCLKTLDLSNCDQITQLPEDIGSMEQLQELKLSCTGIRDVPNSILHLKNLKNLSYSKYVKPFVMIFPHSMRILFQLSSLRKLDLSCCDLLAEDFPGDLHAWSSMEELDLSLNSNLFSLPTSINHLSKLKVLKLQDCQNLEELKELPVSLQVLKANGCTKLKRMENLSTKFELLYKISFWNCFQLARNRGSGGYGTDMLSQSFLEKCAAVNHRLSVAVPGCKVPDWFDQQECGRQIAIKLPSNWHTKIKGFAICSVFGWGKRNLLRINFKFANSMMANNKPAPKQPADHFGNVWIGYIPFDFFQRIYHDFQPQDWSQKDGYLVMSLSIEGYDPYECGAHIVYKKDVNGIQSVGPQISDYGNLLLYDKEAAPFDNSSANVYLFDKKYDDNKTIEIKI